VLFLDRHHDRARAYIERARSAQAERQRQTEMLLHQGLDAFDRGDVDRARGLLREAIDRGASHDLALGVLGRIERLDAASGRPERAYRPRRTLRARPASDTHIVSARPPAAPLRFWAATVALVAALSAGSWWVWTTSSWTSLWPAQAAAARMASIPEVNAPLPVPAAAEAYLRRGQDLFASGRLRDALAELERVPPTDPLRAMADDLRARIQRELLALALADTVRVAPAAPAPPGRLRE
jgi:tetratricopeptide (TPR) repeat protein